MFGPASLASIGPQFVTWRVLRFVSGLTLTLSFKGWWIRLRFRLLFLLGHLTSCLKWCSPLGRSVNISDSNIHQIILRIFTDIWILKSRFEYPSDNLTNITDIWILKSNSFRISMDNWYLFWYNIISYIFNLSSIILILYFMQYNFNIEIFIFLYVYT